MVWCVVSVCLSVCLAGWLAVCVFLCLSVSVELGEGRGGNGREDEVEVRSRSLDDARLCRAIHLRCTKVHKTKQKTAKRRAMIKGTSCNEIKGEEHIFWVR